MMRISEISRNSEESEVAFMPSAGLSVKRISDKRLPKMNPAGKSLDAV
jgi:hypothetical protein